MAQMDAQQQPPIDKYAHVQQTGPVEVPAYNGPIEMDASYYQQPHPAK
jgi:hypothetical protein